MNRSKKKSLRLLTLLLSLVAFIALFSHLSADRVYGLGDPRFPVDKSLGSWYGLTYWAHGDNYPGNYRAIDLNLPNDKDNGQKVYAVQDGVVTFYDPSQGGIIIKHTVPLVLRNGYTYSTWYSFYGHMKNMTVSKGKSVSKGTVIGYIGSVSATSPHLHFALYEKNTKADTISPYWLPGEYYDYNLYADNPYGKREPAGLYETLIFSEMPGGNTTPTIKNMDSLLTANWVDSLGTTSAQINGTFANMQTVSSIGFYMGTSATNMVKKTESANGKVAKFWYNTNKWYGTLTPGTKYFYKFHCTIGGQTYETSVKNFTTKYLAPSAATLTVSSSSVNVGETLHFTATGNNNPTTFTIGIDKGGKRVLTQYMPEGKLSLNTLEAGSYTAYVTASNEEGGKDSARISFEVKTVNPFKTFSDVATSHWAYQHIGTLGGKGIVSGYKGTTQFKPEAPVNRQEAAKMIAEGAGLKASSNFYSDFSDLNKASSWAYPYIYALEEYKVITGFGQTDEFRPTKNIQRNHAAKMLVLAFDLEMGGQEVKLTDIKGVDCEAYIRILASNGIVGGYKGSDQFKPKAESTRAELAKIIDLAMQLKGR